MVELTSLRLEELGCVCGMCVNEVDDAKEKDRGRRICKHTPHHGLSMLRIVRDLRHGRGSWIEVMHVQGE